MVRNACLFGHFDGELIIVFGCAHKRPVITLPPEARNHSKAVVCAQKAREITFGGIVVGVTVVNHQWPCEVELADGSACGQQLPIEHVIKLKPVNARVRVEKLDQFVETLANLMVSEGGDVQIVACTYGEGTQAPQQQFAPLDPDQWLRWLDSCATEP